MESLEKDTTPTMEISISCHKMTKEEIKQSKLESKQRKKEYHKNIREERKKLRKLRKNFRTMDSCMIHPTNIKVGNLEKCIYSRLIETVIFMGCVHGYIDEKYEPIEGEKVFIKIKDNVDCYVDLDEINSNKDLHEIRDHLTISGVCLGGKILDCGSGIIRIDRKSLHSHPYFAENDMDTPISIKQLKKIVAQNN